MSELWTDDDETRLAQLFKTLPPHVPGMIGNLGPTAPELARMVLQDQVDAGWRKITGVVRFDHAIAPEDFERFKAEFERATQSGAWSYEVRVRRQPWWRRLLQALAGRAHG